MPGRTATWTDLPLDQVITAVELQADAAEPSTDTWSSYTRASLAEGSAPRRAVAELGSAGARFLNDVDDSLPDPTTVQLPESDAVHGDLELGNILVRDDTQSIAILDIDAYGPGTRALDYAWLLRDAWTHDASLATRGTLREHGEAVAGPDVFVTCMGLACVELVAFVANHGDPHQALTEIERLTPLLRARCGTNHS